jgi:thiol-disulfide isomerase/thioredoxin
MKKNIFIAAFFLVSLSFASALKPVPGIADLMESAAKNPTVIFFHASWCPTCRIALRDLEDKKKDWEGKVSVYLADYDKERDLKRRYGVARQHTWVQLGPDGTLIRSWNGGGVGQLLQKTLEADG